MHFTRLRLNGFKSFVDPTDLVIAEGLTGVVGPNGCGKSNLLEALRWVMGENRPTAMRGAGMEDVIFAGTATRPPKGAAEVQLHIDNTDRRAPAAFNDADALEITRRITREAGSAYRAGSREVRARDVAMLFADASTGAHSPALVRQGQIAELVNARPKARRRILEEAAGISGLHQRRHEAELKLNAAEANLTRVEDLIDQLAGQLAQLARQAKQAVRYREIGTALRTAEGQLLYRRWQEADTARRAAEADLAERATAAGRAEAAARDAEADRGTKDGAVAPLREEDTVAAAVLQRLQVERDGLAEREAGARRAVAALEERIAQLDHDMEREAELNRDAEERVGALDRELAELAAAGEGHDARLDAAAKAAETAAETLSGGEEAFAEARDRAADIAARHQSVKRARDEAAAALRSSEADSAKALGAADDAEAEEGGATAALETATAAQAEATAAAAAAEAALTESEADRAAAQTAESEAGAARAEAEGAAAALRAERDALAGLVEREGGSESGLIDAVSVEAGYEKALGAALADDLQAPEVSDDTASGWVALADYAVPQPLPEGAEPLAGHVTGPPALARRIAQVGLVAAETGPRLHGELRPGQRLVSVAGDLWRWDGFRANADDAPSREALRLEQINRLHAVEGDLAKTEARATEARAAHDGARTRLTEATEADRRARETRRTADETTAEAVRALSRAEADRSRAENRRVSLRSAAERHEAEAETARTRLAEAEEAFGALEDPETARTAAEAARESVEAARSAMLAARAEHGEIVRAGERRATRQDEARHEMAGWRGRLETAEARIGELAARKESSERELAEAVAAPDAVAAERATLDGRIADAEARREAAAAALGAAEAALRAAEQTARETERQASEAREARAGAEARAEAAHVTSDAAAERIAEERETSPEALLEALGGDPEAFPDAEALDAEIARLRRARDALGAVNLRAEEDARETQEEHDGLLGEKQDLEEAIRQLRNGIADLNREGRERLLAAFERVNANFATLFAHLFGGGEAKLVLVESDDPLEAGLEIMCQPPGKKLATLSLLSGGEQTLTALALIFAVFLANPAPICVLDEVDAPLDDANVTRFCQLLEEMTRRTETRFLVITHHAITMSRMDRLFGVTMGEQGVSQLVSVDLNKAEAMVA